MQAGAAGKLQKGRSMKEVRHNVHSLSRKEEKANKKIRKTKQRRIDKQFVRGF